MTSWEYHEELFNVKVPGGMFAPFELKSSAVKRLNELGRQGWELVSTIPYVDPVIGMSASQTRGYIAFFRRQSSK